MAGKAQFTKAQLDTLKDVVRTVKGTPTDLTGDRYGKNVSHDVITAKLTSRDGTDTSLYAWTQAVRQGSGWQDLTDTGLSGTTTATPAIDIRVQALRFDMTSRYVVMVRGVRKTMEDDGEGGTTSGLETVWYIVGYPPIIGMYQFMTYQNLTDTTVGMQGVAGHPDYT